MTASTRPRVSIGLPVYNGGRFLRSALDSILAQTYRDFELVVSDNGSQDDTDAICREYAARDERIRYHRNPQNLGAAENYNQVFERASGQYFKWAAHDDMLAPEFLEHCVAVLDAQPSVVLCYAQTMLIDEDGREIEPYRDSFDFTAPGAHARFSEWVLHERGRLCNAVGGLIRSDVLRRTGLIGDYKSADVTLIGELLLWGRFEALPDLYFFRRDHPGRSMRAHDSDEELAVWYNPSNKGKPQTPVWRSLFAYLKAIHRAPTGISEKLRCYRSMGEWCYNRRWRLKQELASATWRKRHRQAA